MSHLTQQETEESNPKTMHTLTLLTSLIEFKVRVVKKKKKKNSYLENVG